MRTKSQHVLRFGSRVLRKYLPQPVYRLIRRSTIAALNSYSGSGRVFVETPEEGNIVLAGEEPAEVRSGATRTIIRRWFSSEVHRDALAKPLAPFICCDKTVVEPGKQFLARLGRERQRCQLVICCAFSGRHRIIERIVEESLSSEEAEHVRWMLTGSSPADGALIQALAAKTRRVAGFLAENSPLGRKWQTCMYFATRYFDAELYGITGSDEIVSSRLVDFVIRKHRDNVSKTNNPKLLPAMYGTMEWLVCHINRRNSLVPQIIKCSYTYDTPFYPFGAGRFYSRPFIEESGGLVFESGKERQLRARGSSEVRSRGWSIEFYTLDNGPLVSVKGEWEQMNRINNLIASPNLTANEFSFAGRALLQNALSESSNKYLFKPASIWPQLIFSNPPTGPE